MAKRRRSDVVEPRTREQWQEAADAAHACLALTAARQYGLIRGGPKVDEGRAFELLRRAALAGVYPDPMSPVRFAVELIREAHNDEATVENQWPDVDDADGSGEDADA